MMSITVNTYRTCSLISSKRVSSWLRRVSTCKRRESALAGRFRAEPSPAPTPLHLSVFGRRGINITGHDS
jgi:hypothetical protein